MSHISSISSDTSHTQSTGLATSSSQVTSSNEESSALTTSATQDEGSIELSTRAQKIQKLNEEFFPSGPKSIRITPEFIERLHEYGLISADDAEKLSPAASATEDEPLSSLEELSQFVERFSDRLKKHQPDSTLLDTLQKAQSIIDEWENNDSASMTEVKAIITELAEFNSSSERQTLSSSDQTSLLQLELAMNIADRLNSGRNASQEINSYLNVLNKYG